MWDVSNEAPAVGVPASLGPIGPGAAVAAAVGSPAPLLLGVGAQAGILPLQLRQLLLQRLQHQATQTRTPRSACH